MGGMSGWKAPTSEDKAADDPKADELADIKKQLAEMQRKLSKL
jgi:polyhydroxyalkanoate synthesis regulator protein